MMTTATEYLRGERLDAGGRILGDGRRARGLLMHFLACLEVARQRRQLLSLDDRALNDFGISRADAEREAMRSFWDLPEHAKPGG